MRNTREIEIPYGDNTLMGEFPQETRTLNIKEPESLLSPPIFKKVLREHLQKNRLDLTNTIVVVADKTRVCGYPAYLPLLAQILLENGMQEGGLRFIIAYGTHPRQSDEECLQSYGHIYNKFPFIHHTCSDSKIFVDCGTTSRGTPIRHRRDVLAASCVITMGPICHHYFAGYGGGRKLIFPGCGERESIYTNHGLYLDSQSERLSPHCQPGVLQNNPIAEDIFEIEEKRQADLSIHGIMNSHGKLCDIVIGAGRETFINACSIHGKLCEFSTSTFPTVIASCGGFPKDINFIQSHKAIHNASMFVNDGGTLIIYSELRDGIGSKTFLPWFRKHSFKDAFKHLSSSYEGNGGTALAMMTKNMRIRIILVTELEEDICQMIGVEKWSHSQVNSFLQSTSSEISYIPNASLLVKKVAH